MRKPWDEYFMDIAFMVSSRSTCPRKKVGAVIISSQHKSIIATGYNGSLPSDPHCDEVGCHIVNSHCTRTIHAETNAINQAAKTGVEIDSAIIYCTCKPCWNCFKNIVQSGIKIIYFREDYTDCSSVLYSNYLKANPHIKMERI